VAQAHEHRGAMTIHRLEETYRIRILLGSVSISIGASIGGHITNFGNRKRKNSLRSSTFPLLTLSRGLHPSVTFIPATCFIDNRIRSVDSHDSQVCWGAGFPFLDRLPSSLRVETRCKNDPRRPVPPQF